ncbi:hypothetical protein XELAEV_18014372mg [Xenopus laevis]|uniref:Uncharacterized protein n=1 Tax=Xenopus laevis TaxID=8355 RepID=A0A974HVD2_XENLA|nr:hypothetical protein XELAEV_18014372mg [Xenopus laevis]
MGTSEFKRGQAVLQNKQVVPEKNKEAAPEKNKEAQLEKKEEVITGEGRRRLPTEEEEGHLLNIKAIRTGLQPIATFQTGVQRVSTFHGEPASTLQGSGSTVIKKIMVSSMNQPVSKNEGIVEVPPPSGGTHVITEEMNWHGGRNGHKMKKLGKKKHHKNRHGGKNHHKMKKIGKHHGGGRKFGKKHRHHK